MQKPKNVLLSTFTMDLPEIQDLSGLYLSIDPQVHLKLIYQDHLGTHL